MGRLNTTAAVAAVALALTACGGGDDSGGRDSQTDEGKAYVEAMMSTYSADMGFTEPQATCIAELAIDTVGVDALQDAGVTPEKIEQGEELLADFTPTEAQADTMVDGVFGCVDFGELMVAQMGAEDIGIPEDKVRCIGDAMAKSDAFKDSLKSEMLGIEATTDDAAIEEAIFGIFDTCEVDFADLMGA